MRSASLDGPSSSLVAEPPTTMSGAPARPTSPFSTANGMVSSQVPTPALPSHGVSPDGFMAVRPNHVPPEREIANLAADYKRGR